MRSGAEYYCRLIAGHRSALSAPGRVGSIIHDFRPAPLLGPAGYPDGPRPEGLPEEGFALLRQRVAAAAPSVGVIVLDADPPVRLATCFRVSGDPLRVATAGHVAAALMTEGMLLERVPDPKPRAVPPKVPYRGLRAVFETPGLPPEDLAVAAAEWAHDNCDLLLLRLAAPSSRPGLPLAGPEVPRLQAGAELCVIGHPLVAPQGSAPVIVAAVFEGPLGGLRASPGLLTLAQAGDGAGIYRHDASTLPGSSGSPVIDLADGLVHGVHVQGGLGQTDPNRAVCLPDVLAEAALLARMRDGVDAAGAGPILWPGPGRPGKIRGVSLAALHQDGAEFAPADGTPEPPLPAGAMADRFDIRDRFYRPSLAPARTRIRPDPVRPDEIGQQGEPFSCTGFALAAAIELQLKARRWPRGKAAPRISAAMLYALATRHDEFLDDRPGGSSLRGVIKGFYHFGAAEAAVAPYRGADPGWHLTIEAAKNARSVTLGAYYRLRPVLSDYQSAVQEAKAVIVSAHLHAGWKRGARPVGRIPPRPGRLGAHAFVITGYDERGFVIRNSWGPDWGAWQGLPGHAHWSYADWAENVIDAWVLRLAPPAPSAFDLLPATPPSEGESPGPYARLRDLRQSALIGHVLHLERDGPRGDGRIGLGQAAIRETALYLGSERGRAKYPALALVFHDPASDPDDLARLCGHMIGPMKANGIYPLHVLYGLDEFRSITLRLTEEARVAAARAKGSGQRLSAFLARRARAVAWPLWDLWQSGCQAAVGPGGGLWLGLAGIGLEAGPREGRPRPLHVAAFGAGSVAAGCVAAAVEGLGFGPAQSLAAVAPVTDLAAQAPGGCRFLQRPLAPEPPPDAAFPGADGDWPDVLARLAGTGGAPRLARGTGRTLAEAATSAETLNALLRHILGRTPAPSRRFS